MQLLFTVNGPTYSSLSFVGTLPFFVNTVLKPSGATGSVTVTPEFVQ